MVEKYFGGTLPAEKSSGDFDEDLIACAVGLRDKVDGFIDQTQINNALAEIFKVVSRANKYIDETTPWILAKDESNKSRLAGVLYNLLDTIRIVSTLLSAFMPSSMPKVWEQIGASAENVSYKYANTFNVLSPTVTVKKGEAIFPRIDVEKEIEELNAIIQENAAKAQAKEQNKANSQDKLEGLALIGIDDFAKVELRTANIIACEPVKKSKKLLKLTLNDGTGERTVASGIAQFYKPDDLIGHTVIIVANLKPAKLCGVESQGMILAADCPNGDVKVIFADDIPTGSKIR